MVSTPPPRPPAARRTEWALALATLLGAAGLLAFARGASLRAGMRTRDTITLITADRYDLSCASPDAVAGHRCAYLEPGKPVLPPAPFDEVLVPYVTTRGQLVYAPGLWRDPAVAARLAQEPPQGIERERLRRFDAHCTLEALGELTAQPRFGNTNPYGPPQRAWVVRPSDCTVER